MKKKEVWKRGTALALSAAMAVTLVPATAAAAEEGIDVPLLADFTFDDEASVLTGGSAKATVNGSYELRDSKDTESGKALYLNGNTSNYLSITDADGNSLLAGKKEITVSYDAKPDRTATNWVFYAAPNTKAQSAPEYYIGAFANGGTTKVERYKNGRTVSYDAATGSDWAHVDIVFSESATTVYVNGLKKGSVENSNAPLTDILGDSGILYIGRANWTSNGEGYQGWIDNFKIYDGALTDEDIVTDEAMRAAVAADKEALTLPEEVIEDFTLPSTGANGSAITWQTEDNASAVIGADGYSVTVKRADDADVTVTFTATITMGGISDTKEINVVVKKNMADADVLKEVIEKLDIADKDEVKGNITLPTTVEVDGTDKVVAVEWKSSDTAVVTDTDQDGKAAGVVTRQEKDVKVTMTATVTCGSESETKEIVLTVKMAPAQKAKTTDYLFAYFTGSEGSVTDEQIYFSTSEDGSQWTDLTANGSPVLSSFIGDKGVRDPYLIRSADGDKFWLIATDLSIYYRGGWGRANATTTGSTNLVVWESDNLVDWSEPRLVDVAGAIPGAGCAWAPEAFYDENTGNYVVYWATASDLSNERGDRMNMYYATTRDFYTFSEPVLWIDRENSIIDTTMIQVGDKYYRASGDGQITIEESDSIYEGWEIIGTLKDIFNNNNYSGAKLEGPEFFKYNEDDYLLDAEGNPVETWGLMCDQYSEGKGYLPFRTTDISDQTTASWSPASDVNFGSLKKRHGTILPVTRAEYNLIMQEIGGLEAESDKEALQTEVDAAVSADEKDLYTEESWKIYEDALAAAEEILADDEASQRKVDEALETLRNAKAGLEEKSVPVELPYVDVSVDDWHYEAVYYNYIQETMTGLDPTHFGPDDSLVRAQFAVILHRLNDEPEVEYEAAFPDVAEGLWYTDAILWAKDTGVVTGYTDTGMFGPSDKINREQMAVMMYRYADYKEYDSDEPVSLDGYKDGDKVSAFAEEAMAWAVGNGIISGKDNGTVLDPQGNATRAECATIIMRFMEKFGK